MASESEADNAVALDKHVIDGRDVKVAISVEQNAPGSAKQWVDLLIPLLSQLPHFWNSEGLAGLEHEFKAQGDWETQNGKKNSRILECHENSLIEGFEMSPHSIDMS